MCLKSRGPAFAFCLFTAGTFGSIALSPATAAPPASFCEQNSLKELSARAAPGSGEAMGFWSPVPAGEVRDTGAWRKDGYGASSGRGSTKSQVLLAELTDREQYETVMKAAEWRRDPPSLSEKTPPATFCKENPVEALLAIALTGSVNSTVSWSSTETKQVFDSEAWRKDSNSARSAPNKRSQGTWANPSTGKEIGSYFREETSTTLNTRTFNDVNEEKRVWALQCLEERGDRSAYTDIERLYFGTGNPREVLKAAARAMAKLSPDDAMESLSRTLTDKDVHYRASSVFGLSYIPGEEVKEMIVSFFNDHPAVREGDKALARRPYAESRPYAIELLEGRDCKAVARGTQLIEHIVEPQNSLAAVAADEEMVGLLEDLSSDRQCNWEAQRAARLLRLIQDSPP